MKTSKILELARNKYLLDGTGARPRARGQESYICWAIGNAADKIGTDVAEMKADAVRSVIMARLGKGDGRGIVTLEQWLHNMKRVPLYELKSPPMMIFPSGCRAAERTAAFAPVPGSKEASKVPSALSRAMWLRPVPL